MISRIREMVHRTVPPEATLIVVSKGDPALLQLGAARAWHFPQDCDGKYAGHHPANSADAIELLEKLRQRGADYILFPSTALWWLDYYADFKRHLEIRYERVPMDSEACRLYLLNPTLEPKSKNGLPLPPRQTTAGNVLSIAFESLPKSVRDDCRTLFDLDYYCEQAGPFPTTEAAIADYMERGYKRNFSPSRLFDPVYYASENLPIRSAGVNPFVHYLTHSVSELQNPNPYFDTAYYYSQWAPLRQNGVNALAHYRNQVAKGQACCPNPLFGNGFYLTTYPDVKAVGVDPFGHFISVGCSEGRFASQPHQKFIEALLGPSKSELCRGSWRDGTILIFCEGESRPEAEHAIMIAEELQRRHGVRCRLVLSRRGSLPPEHSTEVSLAVLDEHVPGGEIFHPSALRLLAKSLLRFDPIFAVAMYPRILPILHAEGITSQLLLEGDLTRYSREDLHAAIRLTARTLLHSCDQFHSLTQMLDEPPARVASLPFDPRAVPAYVHAMMRLAGRDFDLTERTRRVERRKNQRGTKKVIIPCCDWALSGVNTALECIGQQLIRIGWDVQIVFTRGRASIGEEGAGESHLPRLPYTFLQPKRLGMEGIWSALLAHVEGNAPCIMLMGYDFVANSVASALTDRVGVVAWAQSDEKNYYEQIYRLGLYCNAVVCVSQCILENIRQLNPVIGARSLVIHNSSILESQVATQKPARSKRMRLIYTGRLVQHQKRILDTIDLALALDRLNVPYEITLVGEFSSRERTEQIFRERAAAHLVDGRIALHPRMTHDRVIAELSRHNFFVLLSEFEGLPLSLIEAMARGCVPVVAQMESGIPEAINHGKNGLIIPGRDYDGWARCLVKCWRNPNLLARLSKAARATVRERFTVEKIAVEFSDVFTRISDEIGSGEYRRLDTLNWGVDRSPTGDVLAPATVLRLPQQNPVSAPAKERRP